MGTSLHIQFNDGKTLALREVAVAVSNSVCVEGRHYAIEGDKSEVAFLLEKLPKCEKSLDDLKIHLKESGATEIKVQAVARGGGGL